MARSREKIFHYLFAVTLLVGSIAYYAMASDLAWDVISQVNETQNGSRQIFFAKYVYWVVSFPVVNIALGLVSGVSCKYIHRGLVFLERARALVAKRGIGIIIQVPLLAPREGVSKP